MNMYWNWLKIKDRIWKVTKILERILRKKYKWHYKVVNFSIVRWQRCMLLIRIVRLKNF